MRVPQLPQNSMVDLSQLMRAACLCSGYMLWTVVTDWQLRYLAPPPPRQAPPVPRYSSIRRRRLAEPAPKSASCMWRGSNPDDGWVRASRVRFTAFWWWRIYTIRNSSRRYWSGSWVLIDAMVWQRDSGSRLVVFFRLSNILLDTRRHRSNTY